MKKIAVKQNNKENFGRSLKELKGLKLWGVDLDFNGKEKKWILSYDENNSETQSRIDRVVGWCWEITEMPKED